MVIRSRLLAVATMTAVSLSAAPALATPALAAPPPHSAAFDKKASSSSPLSVPVSTPDFAGTLSITQLSYDEASNSLLADGVVTGHRLSDKNKKKNTASTTFENQPVTLTPQAAAGPEGAVGAAALPVPAGCDIVNLFLPGLSLNILGLVVVLQEVQLDIVAVPGAGNLLGNLLCAVAGLLDGPTGLGGLINQLLAIVNRLLAGLAV